MQNIIKSRKYCYDFTNTPEGSVIYFGKTHNTTDLVIEVEPSAYPPYILYYEWHKSDGNSSLLHYQWCGALVTILTEFAKRVNAKLQFLPQESDHKTLLMRFYTGKAHISAMPITAAQWGAIVSGTEGRARISHYVDYKYESKILAKTIKGEWTLFNQFKCLDSEVYLAIFVSMLFMCLVIGLRQKSFAIFFNTLWKYFSVLLSDNYSYNSNNIFDRFMTALWLMACIVIMAAFSGQLWSLLVRSQPIDMMESWNDLYSKPQWNQLKIQTFFSLDMHSFAYNPQNVNNSMAKDFKNRFENILSPLDYVLGKKDFDRDIDYNGVIEGRLAQVHSYVFLEVIKQNIIAKGYREDIDFHISKYGSQPQPVFLVYNPYLMNAKLGKAFDLIISLFLESGVYEQQIFNTLNPKKFGPNFDSKIDILYTFNAISMNQMKGILYFYLMAKLFCIISYILEYVIYKMLHVQKQIFYSRKNSYFFRKAYIKTKFMHKLTKLVRARAQKLSVSDLY